MHRSPIAHLPSRAQCLHAVTSAFADRPPRVAQNAYRVLGATTKASFPHRRLSGSNHRFLAMYAGARTAKGSFGGRAARYATRRFAWSPLNGGLVTSASCGGEAFAPETTS